MRYPDPVKKGKAEAGQKTEGRHEDRDFGNGAFVRSQKKGTGGE